jgi:hypothetical protein
MYVLGRPRMSQISCRFVMEAHECLGRSVDASDLPRSTAQKTYRVVNLERPTPFVGISLWNAFGIRARSESVRTVFQRDYRLGLGVVPVSL